MSKFDELWNEHDGTHHYKDEYKDFIRSSLKSLYTSEIAFVEGLKRTESDYDDEDKKSRRDVRPFNEALDVIIIGLTLQRDGVKGKK